MKYPMRWIVAFLALAGIGLTGVLYQGKAEPAYAAAISERTEAAVDAPVITVYKSPSCTCCAEWAEHLEEHGFQIDIQKAGWDLMQIKTEHGIVPELASCHTATVADYVIEGHVPADLIRELLEEQPDLRALAVPGMPAGVPGMPKAGKNRRTYQVFAIGHDGSSSVYATR